MHYAGAQRQQFQAHLQQRQVRLRRLPLEEAARVHAAYHIPTFSAALARAHAAATVVMAATCGDVSRHLCDRQRRHECNTDHLEGEAADQRDDEEGNKEIVDLQRVSGARAVSCLENVEASLVSHDLSVELSWRLMWRHGLKVGESKEKGQQRRHSESGEGHSHRTDMMGSSAAPGGVQLPAVLQSDGAVMELLSDLIALSVQTSLDVSLITNCTTADLLRLHRRQHLMQGQFSLVNAEWRVASQDAAIATLPSYQEFPSKMDSALATMIEVKGHGNTCPTLGLCVRLAVVGLFHHLPVRLAPYRSCTTTVQRQRRQLFSPSSSPPLELSMPTCESLVWSRRQEQQRVLAVAYQQAAAVVLAPLYLSCSTSDAEVAAVETRYCICLNLSSQQGEKGEEDRCSSGGRVPHSAQALCNVVAAATSGGGVEYSTSGLCHGLIQVPRQDPPRQQQQHMSLSGDSSRGEKMACELVATFYGSACCGNQGIREGKMDEGVRITSMAAREVVVTVPVPMLQEVTLREGKFAVLFWSDAHLERLRGTVAGPRKRHRRGDDGGAGVLEAPVPCSIFTCYPAKGSKGDVPQRGKGEKVLENKDEDDMDNPLIIHLLEAGHPAYHILNDFASSTTPLAVFVDACYLPAAAAAAEEGHRNVLNARAGAKGSTFRRLYAEAIALHKIGLKRPLPASPHASRVGATRHDEARKNKALITPITTTTTNTSTTTEAMKEVEKTFDPPSFPSASTRAVPATPAARSSLRLHYSVHRLAELSCNDGVGNSARPRRTPVMLFSAKPQAQPSLISQGSGRDQGETAMYDDVERVRRKLETGICQDPRQLIPRGFAPPCQWLPPTPTKSDEARETPPLCPFFSTSGCTAMLQWARKFLITVVEPRVNSLGFKQQQHLLPLDTHAPKEAEKDEDAWFHASLRDQRVHFMPPSLSCGHPLSSSLLPRCKPVPARTAHQEWYVLDQHAVHERLRLEYFLVFAEAFVMHPEEDVDDDGMSAGREGRVGMAEEQLPVLAGSAAAGETSRLLQRSARAERLLRRLRVQDEASKRMKPRRRSRPIELGHSMTAQRALATSSTYFSDLPAPVPADLVPLVTTLECALQRWGWRFEHRYTTTDQDGFLRRTAVAIAHWPTLCVEGHELRLRTVEDLRVMAGELAAVGAGAAAGAGGGAYKAGGEIIPSAVLAFLISRSCRGAIMFGDTLDDSAVRTLLTSLPSIEQFYVCSHGRPSIAYLRALGYL